MNQRDRERRAANERRQSPVLPSEGRAPAVDGVWLGNGAPAVDATDVFWLKRPMPDGQWPPDQRAPRDDSFRWWVRSGCGHALKQWAFYEEAEADKVAAVFKTAACQLIRCPEFMIKNNGRM